MNNLDGAGIEIEKQIDRDRWTVQEVDADNGFDSDDEWPARNLLSDNVKLRMAKDAEVYLATPDTEAANPSGLVVGPITIAEFREDGIIIDNTGKEVGAFIRLLNRYVDRHQFWLFMFGRVE